MVSDYQSSALSLTLMHYFVGTNGTFNQFLTFLCCVDFDQGIKTSLNVQSLSHLSDSSKVNVVATQHESSLFSSSLSELFSRKCKFSLPLNVWFISFTWIEVLLY